MEVLEQVKYVTISIDSFDIHTGCSAEATRNNYYAHMLHKGRIVLNFTFD